MRAGYFFLALFPAVVLSGFLSDGLLKIIITADGGGWSC